MKRMLLSLVVLTLFISFLGCGDNDDDDDDIRADLRVLHASPDAPEINVFVDDDLVFSELSFGEVTDYEQVDGDPLELRVSAVNSFTTYIDGSSPLTDDTNYTLVVLDFEDSISSLLLEDDDSPAPSNRVKLRMVHAAPSAPDIDVYVLAPDEVIGTLQPAASELAFEEVTDYLQSIEGDYQITVVEKDTLLVLAQTEEISLSDGAVRTAVVLDDKDGGTPFEVIMLEDHD